MKYFNINKPYFRGLLALVCLFSTSCSCGIVNHKYVVGNLAVSPDGRWVVFCTENEGRYDLNLLDLGTGKTNSVIKSDDEVGYPVFISQHQLLISTKVSGKPQLFELDLNTGLKKRVLESNFSDTSPSISVDGNHIVFVRATNGFIRSYGQQAWDHADLYIADSTFGSIKKLTNLGARVILSVNVSTGNSKIVYAYEIGDGLPEVHVMDTGSGKTTQLTHGPHYNTDPSWSPDGQRIAFSSDRIKSYEYEIWTMKEDGSEQREVTHTGKRSTWPKFLPDGKSLVFSVDETQIWQVNLDGTGLHLLWHH
ncbi:MAG: hypothetical protein ABJA67_15065 [Chthonomonadales bacterium]